MRVAHILYHHRGVSVQAVIAGGGSHVVWFLFGMCTALRVTLNICYRFVAVVFVKGYVKTFM